jgi:hypothetical protein
MQDEQSIGELFSELSQQASKLVRQEVQLVKAEMTQKARKATRQIALIAIGAVLANAALLSIVAFLVLLLAQWMDAWLAALLVGILVGGAAALLAMKGINELKEMTPAPERTLQTLREDKEWLAQQMS